MKTLFKRFIFIGLIYLSSSCHTGQEKKDEQPYLRQVGDITSDLTLDNPDFKICNGEEYIFQYFNTGEGFKYQGEKTALVSQILNTYKPISNIEDQSGYIRIRFIVNCEGDAGRFRMISSDIDYQEKVFDRAITNQLITILKDLDGWVKLTENKNPLDYYLYLIFKLDNGHIIEILP
jgi:hypothetical protein